MKNISDYDFEKGELLLFNKPSGWTSFDVVNKIRWASGAKKVGHAGTLDPLATGLLILCTGKMTKQISEFQDLKKEYTGTIKLGITTDSYDLEMPVNAEFSTQHITQELLKICAEKFIGKIAQVPPAYSAKRMDGGRAYQKARNGEMPVMKPHEVEITEFELTKTDLLVSKTVDFRVVCSKGTYIRSLAFDLGKSLDSGACLASLCRTKIGSFLLENALEVVPFAEELKKNKVQKIF